MATDTKHIIHANTIQFKNNKVLFDCDFRVREKFIQVVKCAYAINDISEECNTWYNVDTIKSIHDVIETI